MTRRTAIVQSNYIPWKGYFDLIASVDAFVLLDEVQYTRRDWRNRNRIKTAAGTRWLTIPVLSTGRYEQRIDETRIADPSGWGRSHWSAIEQAYRDAPWFEAVAAELEPLYRSCDAELLSEVNATFLHRLCELLAIDTPISWSTEYETAPDPSRRLLDVCLQTGATEYVSGPSARDYLDVGLFERAGVAVSWADYSGYEPYSQPHGPFEHGVSVIDLLFCAGPGAGSRRLLKAGAVGAGVR